MGNTPSQPTDEQVEELKEKRNQMIEAAAAAIATADVLLVTTGAGWSADSGLAVYKDVADVPAYHKRELTYHALCNPGVLDEDPALFHGFWGGCFNDYRKATLSPGYALVAGWCDRRFRGTPTSEELAELIRQDEQDPKRYPLLEARELARARAAGKEPAAEPTAANAEAASAIPRPERGASAFFSFTSNVDAHWTTVCRPGELRECHGNTEMWQCTDLSCAAALETEARGSGPSPVAGGRWRAPPSFRFRVDERTREAPDGPALAWSAGVGSGQPHDAEAFAHNWPRCVRCGGKARPSVLMFGDSQWQDDQQQQAGWESWREQLMALASSRAPTTAADGEATGEPGVAATPAADAPPAAAKPPSARPLRVVIMEAGAGGNVTTVRQKSESVLEDRVRVRDRDRLR
jgi:NAD-dependent SIR2 family protein deacetylase